MSDPIRFTETEPQSSEATLLRSMRSDAPGDGSKKALLGALGLSAVGGLSGSAAASSSASSGWAGAGVAKWLGVVGLCGAVLGAGYAAWNGTSSLEAVRSPGLKATNFGVGAVSVAQALPVPVPASPAISPPVAEPSQPITSARPAESGGGRAAATPPPAAALSTARTPERRAAASVSAQGLSDEVAALERARRALADDNGATALKALSEYDREFKQRTLGPEAEALRIEALMKSGNAAAGNAAAQAFLARHPKSPLAKRVRSLMAQTESSK